MVHFLKKVVISIPKMWELILLENSFSFSYVESTLINVSSV
ncbi:hypothetical protein G436_4343 [Leptospira interrogans serovar Hardjo str. Norma]|uniref:Uncharacterized protein n=1 Tax=Leptospira interrogans serovar Hardjo str. Norma TaxID=1279460 RepID=A0A0M4MY66_LEPIR|nr:hypothetical protein G436_4343 [Leptospira interrogans serovar Hardjo str. Norma]EKO97665.1 hypothetical protein LEP1GSC057_2784 [Leptospira interrogans str. Brem 329]